MAQYPAQQGAGAPMITTVQTKAMTSPYDSAKKNLLTVTNSYNTKKEARQSSLIAPWLTIDRTPAGLSQRIGYIVEDFCALDMGDQNKLILTDYTRGRNFMIRHEGSNHQLDLLSIPTGWDKYVHREIKSNTDLDAGKKRDTLKREESICAWMESKGWAYDSGIFCPFFFNKGKHVSGLGWVDGLEWYVETFKPDWTVQDFINLGADPDFHRALGLID